MQKQGRLTISKSLFEIFETPSSQTVSHRCLLCVAWRVQGTAGHRGHFPFFLFLRRSGKLGRKVGVQKKDNYILVQNFISFCSSCHCCLCVCWSSLMLMMMQARASRQRAAVEVNFEVAVASRTPKRASCQRHSVHANGI